MTLHIAAFGEMGLKYVHLIEAALNDMAGWQVDVWPCDNNLTIRDTLLETCEAAIMGPDFILTPGNFAALIGHTVAKPFL